MHTDLVRNFGYPRDFDPSDVVQALLRMEERGWVTSYEDDDMMGRRPPDRAYWARALGEYREWYREAASGYFDEMGPWVEITPRGRAAWEQGENELRKSEGDHP